MSFQSIKQLIDEEFPLVHDPTMKKLSYGTAGFRTTGRLLPPVAARVVLLAVLRGWWCTERHTTEGAFPKRHIGFMITASHNPAVDNGFKIIDSDGGMLAQNWEHYTNVAANCKSGDEFVSILEECIDKEGIKTNFLSEEKNNFGGVLLGRDTRSSGAVILAAVKAVLEACGILFQDFGIITTPQLHYIVAEENKRNETASESGGALVCKTDISTYSKNTLEAFDALMQLMPFDRKHEIVIDCSNGVGAIGMERMLDGPEGCILRKYFDIFLVNTDTHNPDALNLKCGADYAKVSGCPSDEMRDFCVSHPADVDVHYYCFDGDADRVIAFDAVSPTVFKLVDGDRIAILYSKFFREALGVDVVEKKLDFGIVQTGYANGASTNYVKNVLQVPVYMAATGVKHLHPIAHSRDIGIYFEANGHGTALCNVSTCLEAAASLSENKLASTVLCQAPRLLSQVCGDAIADFLACEVSLHFLSLSFAEMLALYEELPARQVKVAVPFPKRIVNTPDETRAVEPAGLQEEVDAAVAEALESLGEGGHARSFVRPSGTEPIARVYAEASTEEACEVLADRVTQIVQRYCT